MNSLLRAQFDIPATPDWAWLRRFWGNSSILHEGVALDYIATREAGRIACIATPGADFDGGAVLAADHAVEWVMACAEAGLIAISPAMISGLAQAPVGSPASTVRAADYVIVPPSDGWSTSGDVWICATLALAAVKPVYVLSGCA